MQQYYEDRDNAKEECIRCVDYTGRTAGEDGLYKTDGTGPYCERCFNLDPLVEAIEEAAAEFSRNQAENIP